MLKAVRKWVGRARRELIRRSDSIGDLRLGIRTGSPLFRSSGIDPGGERNIYEPLQYQALATIERRVPVGLDDVIYDLGGGRGRVVCYFAAHAVRRVVGVEYDPALADLARQNVAAMRGRRAPVEILTGDAGALDYFEASILFMYNPFGPDTLRQVLENAVRTTGPLRIVYANPVHAAVFAAFPALQAQEPFKAPYGSSVMPVGVWCKS